MLEDVEGELVVLGRQGRLEGGEVDELGAVAVDDGAENEAGLEAEGQVVYRQAVVRLHLEEQK